MKETEQTLLEIPDIISSLSIPSVGPTEFEQKCRWLREQMDLYATAKAQASCEATLLPEEKKDFHDFLGEVAIEAQKTDRTIGNSFDEAMSQNNDDKPHSYTESAYKEVESSEPQEKEPYVLEVVGNFLHSSGLVFNTDDADNVASDLIRYLKVEGISIAKAAPSESQEEMWKKHCEQEALWDSAMQIGNSEKTYKAAIHKIMKYFSITRKPE